MANEKLRIYHGDRSIALFQIDLLGPVSLDCLLLPWHLAETQFDIEIPLTVVHRRHFYQLLYVDKDPYGIMLQIVCRIRNWILEFLIHDDDLVVG